MKVKNNKKTTLSLSNYCSLYIEKFNVHQLNRTWKKKAAFAAATATVATGMFLGTSSVSVAQNGITCAPVFNQVGALPITNPELITPTANYSRPQLVDYDGDGDFDLLVGEKFGANINYYENIGTNTAPIWGANQVNPNGLTIAQNGRSPFLVDIDGDGDKDAFIGTVDSGIAFRENTGNDTNPVYGTTQIDPFGIDTGLDSYIAPTFADIDNDGDLDLLFGTIAGDILFQRNTGSSTAPSFGARQANPFGTTNVGSYTTPAFGDLDSDGDLDLMVGEKNGNFNYFTNTGSVTVPTFAGALNNPFDLDNVASSSAPTFADLDNDGDLDLFSGDKAGNATYFKNGGTPTNADFFALAYNLPQVNNGADPTFVDIDGDGDKDAFIGQQVGGDFIFVENIGDNQNPSFSSTTIANPFGLQSSGTYSSLAFSDMDNDGDYDLISSNNTGNLFYHQNTGTATAATFAAPITNPFGLVGASAGAFGTPAIVDMDNDGDMDIVVGGGSGNTAYFQNTGSIAVPTFAAPLINPFGLANVGIYSSPVFADIDGDGDVDGFVGNDNSLLFFANNGTPELPSFTAPTTLPFGLTLGNSNYNMPYLVDINGDGSLDMFIGQTSGITFAFENSKISPTISIARTGNFNDCNVEQVKATINYSPTAATVTWYNALNNTVVATGIEFNPEDLQFRGNYYAMISTTDGCTDKSSTLSYEPVVPPVGTNLSAQAGYNMATLNWAREGSCDAPIREYEVYADPGQFGTYFLFGYSPTTNFDAVGLINGEKINFKVRPVFVNGTYGAYSNVVTVKPSIVLGEEDNDKAGFAFFPNPNNGEFNLRLQDGSASATVSVTSLSGQQVYTTTLNATQTSVNLGNIASGMYIVRVETAQGTYQQKVSVVR